MPNKTQDSKVRLIVLGNLNMDLMMVSDEMPGVGEYIYGKELHFIPGGNGLNAATAASRLGADVQIIGFVGNDGFGLELTNFLQNENVNISNIKTLKNTTSGTVVYLLTNKVERHLVFPGSNMKVSISDVPDVKFLESDIVICALAISYDVIKHTFEKARDDGAKTMLNLFPNYDVSKDLLQLSDYLLLNEVELAFRTGDVEFVRSQHKDLHMTKEEILARAKQLRTRADQTIIVTLAERGVIGIKGDSMTIVDGIKVKFVDATGAGDCFLGAFATGLTEGMSFKNALELANSAAAISVQKIGTTTSYPSRNEAEALLKKQK